MRLNWKPGTVQGTKEAYYGSYHIIVTPRLAWIDVYDWAIYRGGEQLANSLPGMIVHRSIYSAQRRANTVLKSILQHANR